MGSVDVMLSCNIARVMCFKDNVQGNFPGLMCSGDDVLFCLLDFLLVVRRRGECTYDYYGI
jgi:hypothetical protein